MKQKRLEQGFAVVAPGFEALCARELEAIGAQDIQTEEGGVAFTGDRRMIYRANLWLRTASRVLVRVGDFRCRDFPALYQKVARLPWGRYLKPEAPLAVRGTSRSSRLGHTGRLQETVQQAVTHALGATPQSSELHPQTVYVRVEQDLCTLSIDSSGDLLHRRGYRQEQGAAPLRETLAAGLLQLAGWRPDLPLWDPFCGSGTLLIEAAQWAYNLAPGRHRTFPFMEWPKYYDQHWQGLLDEFPPEPHPIAGLFGSDKDEKVIAIAGRNAQRACVAEFCRFAARPLGPWEALPQGPGLILSNPPYGERLEDEASVVELLGTLKDVLQGPCADWRALLLLPDNRLLKKAGLAGHELARLSNGGLNVRLFEIRRS